MNLKIDKNAFLNKLNSKAVFKGPTLKHYVSINLEFLIDCRARGYTLSALSEVISDDLGKKIYPSNLGRLLRKYQAADSENQSNLSLHLEAIAPEVSLVSDAQYEKLFESNTSKGHTSQSQHDKDPLGIGGLM